jgi:cell filamentation protein, protein adenylyltransferase
MSLIIGLDRFWRIRVRMAKIIRVSELSRELGVETSFVIEILRRNGGTAQISPATAIEQEVAERIRGEFGGRDGTPYLSNPSTIWEFFPEQESEIELDPDTIARIKSLSQEVGAFREGGPLKPIVAKKLSEYFRLQHIFHSTGIEGNRLTLRETEVVLMEGVQLNDKPLSDQLEVKDLAAAFRFLEEGASSESVVREIDLREMHRLTVCNNPEADPGAYRKAGVVISGSELKPPEPLAIPGLMEALVSWVKRPKDLDRLAFATIAHHKLVAIHPFLDGNGRVARLLLNLLLMKAGYPIVNIRREDRPRYYEALSFADVGLYSPLLNLTLDRALEIFREMKRVQEETDRMRQWADQLGEKEAEVEQRREERGYRIWLSSFETVKLEFQSRAELLDDELDSVEISFKPYPAPDLTKYLVLRDKGRAPQTWFFSLRFRQQNEAQTFFFRFFRDYNTHQGERTIPLQLNWFKSGEETPVDAPSIRLREIWIDKERGLMVRRVDAGRPVTVQEASAVKIAEQFFEDVLRACFGIG